MMSGREGGDDVVLKSEASSTLALKQDSTNILSWDAAGAVTVSAVSGQPDDERR